MKKKIKNKYLPKFSDSGSLFGSTVPLADSTMIDGYDSGLSSTIQDKPLPKDNSSKFGMAGGIMGGIGGAMPSQVELTSEQQALEKGKDQMAQSNPFIGFFRGIEKMGNSIGGAIGGKKGEETMRSITDPFQNGLGSLKNKNLTAGQKALQFLPFGNFALPDLGDNFEKRFEPINKNASKISFGVPTYALGGVPYSQGDIEAEQGEAMLKSNNNIENIEGQKHEQGGTPLKLNGNEQYIYSDRLGYNKQGLPTFNIKDVSKSFADKAKSIEKKYSNKKDRIAEKTKELELNKLTQDAEQIRQVKEQLDMSKDINKLQAKYGANLKKFAYSGVTPNKKLYTPYTDFNNNTTFGVQQMLLENDAESLPKSGADGLWGSETNNALKAYNDDLQFNRSVNVSVPQPNLKFQFPEERLGDSNVQNIVNDVNIPVFKNNEKDFKITGKNERNGLFKNLTQGDKLQLAGMLPGTLYNIGMGLKKAEKEKFYTNPYQNEVVGLMQNRRFDAQPFINEAQLTNTAMNEEISNNASSIGVKLANLQKAHANYNNTIANITGKAQEINNGYRAEEATAKNQLGEVLRQEGIRQADINARNKATKQGFMAKGITQLGQGITSIGQASNQSLTNTMLSKSLSEISPDFDMNKLKDLYDRGKVDKEGYFHFNGTKYQYVPNLNQVIKV